MTHRASCQCGQLGLEMSAEPELNLVCGCTRCQKRSGSGFAGGAFFRKEAVTIHSDWKTWTRPASDGRTLTNHFCPDCGTTLFWSLDLRPDFYGVAVGCMDTPLPEPETALWADEAPGWVSFPDHWTVYRRSIAES